MLPYIVFSGISLGVNILLVYLLLKKKQNIAQQITDTQEGRDTAIQEAHEQLEKNEEQIKKNEEVLKHAKDILIRSRDNADSK